MPTPGLNQDSTPHQPAATKTDMGHLRGRGNYRSGDLDRREPRSGRWVRKYCWFAWSTNGHHQELSKSTNLQNPALPNSGKIEFHQCLDSFLDAPHSIDGGQMYGASMGSVFDRSQGGISQGPDRERNVSTGLGSHRWAEYNGLSLLGIAL
ncbi:hypothetical protein K493DRAFT_302739 [Basidiobolus meristosporus CBS 931.73]|uniref:Uncharacterized protein n=1 Tax=Basidiobolus meristosporus CBS 931.73 TaxID=1314790 RepID=A0A1Y1Y5M0_9FUNG|nr:hypothetical protein K493DRAFT_302739 [Basidiobolus meristosporus CBS 931.73]|eukprot:ORX93320.1 hypothetical protein K493DRAFT_302739 [Basidiobolus meristosporus CBS 931.73]